MNHRVFLFFFSGWVQFKSITSFANQYIFFYFWLVAFHTLKWAILTSSVITAYWVRASCLKISAWQWTALYMALIIFPSKRKGSHNIKESIRDTVIRSNCDVYTGCIYNYNKWNFPKTTLLFEMSKHNHRHRQGDEILLLCILN